jgi:hypothetical protein
VIDVSDDGDVANFIRSHGRFFWGRGPRG